MGKKITIVVKDRDNDNVERTLVLREPGFDELATAYNIMMAGITSINIPDFPKAGKFLITACAIEGESDKMFFADGNGKLMLAAANQAATLVEVFDGELKKN